MFSGWDGAMDGRSFESDLVALPGCPGEETAATAPGCGQQRTGTTAPLLDGRTTYLCPDEHHPISRAVHLARLAAFYPQCRICEHRRDTGQIPHSTLELLEATAQRHQRGSLFASEGVRGVYLNQLSRAVVARMGAAFASVLWEEHVLSGAPVSDLASGLVPASTHVPRGPQVVIGHDSRTSSPDLCVGLAAALRRMECEVVDVGQVSRPGLSFAVHHLQADGGVYVGGQGFPPAWNGLDFVGQCGAPWSKPGRLEAVEDRFAATIARPSRRGGRQRFFDSSVPYRASFWKHLHDLAGLRVVYACKNPAVMRTLAAWSESLSMELIPAELESRGAGPSGGAAGLGRSVTQSQADFGLLIEPDGQGCHVWDERGTQVSDEALLCALARSLRRTAVSAVVWGTDEPAPAQPSAVGALPFDVTCVASTSEAVVEGLQRSGATLGYQPGGRFWMEHGPLTCDGILTLTQILQLLQRSGRKASEVFVRPVAANGAATCQPVPTC